VIVFHDITASQAMSMKMAHLAQHDFLTALPNRALLTERLEQAIALARRRHKQVALLYLDRRTGIAQVELGFSEEPAVQESSRCIHCWFNTIFDGREEEASECILCGACADICPEWCIDILPRRVFSGELSLMNESRGPDQANGLSGPSLMDSQALIIKDESRCIRCGLCAKRCPVNCISMQGIFFGEAR